MSYTYTQIDTKFLKYALSSPLKKVSIKYREEEESNVPALFLLGSSTAILTQFMIGTIGGVIGTVTLPLTIAATGLGLVSLSIKDAFKNISFKDFASQVFRLSKNIKDMTLLTTAIIGTFSGCVLLASGAGCSIVSIFLEMPIIIAIGYTSGDLEMILKVTVERFGFIGGVVSGGIALGIIGLTALSMIDEKELLGEYVAP